MHSTLQLLESPLQRETWPEELSGSTPEISLLGSVCVCWGTYILYLHFTSHSIIEGSRGRNSNEVGTLNQVLMQKMWKIPAYYIASPSIIAYFLIPLRSSCPIVIPSTVSLPTGKLYRDIFSIKDHYSNI